MFCHVINPFLVLFGFCERNPKLLRKVLQNSTTTFSRNNSHYLHKFWIDLGLGVVIFMWLTNESSVLNLFPTGTTDSYFSILSLHGLYSHSAVAATSQWHWRIIYKNTGFHWPILTCIRTKSTILSRIFNSVLIRENTGPSKPVFSHILCSMACGFNAR